MQPHPDADFKIDGSEVTQVGKFLPTKLYIATIYHHTNVLTPQPLALICRPSPLYLHPSHKQYLQSRRRHRSHRGKTVD